MSNRFRLGFRLVLPFGLLLLACVLAEGAAPGRKVVRDSTKGAQRIQVLNPPVVEQGSNTEDLTAENDGQLQLPQPLNFWQRERKNAAKKGFHWYLESSGEYFHTLKDPSGNRNRSYYHDVYLELSLDLFKAGYAPRGTAFVSIVGGREKVFSDPPTGFSDLEDSGKPADTNPGAGASFQLYELWYERTCGKAVWLVGLRDITSDFCVLRFNDALTNEGFWFSPTIAENTPLNVYDLACLGVRVQVPLSSRWHVAAGLFEGTPGTAENNSHGLEWRLKSSEGSFRIGELQWKNPLGLDLIEGNFKIGNWYHTGTFDDLRNLDEEENPLMRRKNWGTYAVFDQKLFNPKGDPDLGLGLFCQAGWQTPNDRSQVEATFGTGFTWYGPFPGRKSDTFSGGLSRKRYSTALRSFSEAGGEAFFTTEEVLEIGYQFQIMPGLTIRPDVQFIKNSGGDPTLPRSRFFSLRCTAVF